MERTVTVTGHGSTSLVPDRAVVRVAVTVVEETVAAAWRRVSALTDLAVATAREVVGDPGLEAHAVSVWPQTDGDRRLRFEARRGVVVHCGDLTVAGALLEALVDEVGDALQVEGIGLEVADPTAALDDARERAFDDAEARARRLAARAGATLGDVLTIDDSAVGGPPYPSARAMKAEAATLVPGEQHLEASLRITWQLV